MTTLGNLLGAMMADVTHARRISDECAVRLAEYYQSEPLLQGLPVPRLRLPEVTIDVPVIVDGYLDGSSHQVKESTELVATFSQAAKSVLETEKVAIDEFEAQFQTTFPPRLEAAMQKTFQNFEGVSLRVRTVRAAQQTVDEILRGSEVEVSARVRSSLQSAFKKMAETEIFESPALDSSISLKVQSNEVKGHAKSEESYKTVTNLRVVLKEEELTWNYLTNSDGTSSSQLMIQ
ncbi:hypothetical protein IQ235_15380 [Oscillatoriales cyanobacterium LEGE 11467]|uniref:Uncharacterized protein n=1 Tax=Zarconia navalis LEGE 11467 TaxID=1828826 RepID=A0A928ZB01_9CYAN|nr:hypothetical protein [Zarconia navalis]MBE9042161.1 hypothetical protein [Zarconia navalis LEGE 11467]